MKDTAHMRTSSVFLVGVFPGRSLVLASAALFVLACSDDRTNPPVESGWAIEREKLPGMILSIGGTSANDIWLAGADARDGMGPAVMHKTAAGWTRLSTGYEGGLWWVFTAGPDASVWFAGEKGRIARHDRTSGTFTEIPTTNREVTFYGIWGAGPAGPVYAVGGCVLACSSTVGADNRALLRIDADTATAVTGLPALEKDAEVYFKVWGTGPSDVWVIGNKGSVLHFDGDAWTRADLQRSPLVTIHGASADDIIVVGGSDEGFIFERKRQSTWMASPDITNVNGLNGVFVAPGGRAIAAGFAGTTLARTGDHWAALETPDYATVADWHGAWIAPDTGDAYVVGGDFFGGLVDGMVLRYRFP